MQTFLPYSDFAQSALCLDRQRLGKQRVEAKQILLALTQPGYGWQNHPAVKMWRGHEMWLSYYGWCVCREWKSRGYNDSLQDWFAARYDEHPYTHYPEWLRDSALHLSHRSNLIRKLPEHYRPLWPDVPDDLPYVWPV